MTVLGIILGIEVAGLAFALLVARAIARQDGASHALRRLAGALERAGRAFLLRQYRQVALLALAIVGVLFAVHAGLGHGGGTFGRLELLFWLTAGVFAGGIGAALSAYAAATLAVRGGMKVVSGARVSLNRALCSAIRLGGAGSVFSEVLALLGPLLLFVMPFAVKGGFTLGPDAARKLAAEVSLLLPPFVLGAAAAALLLHRGAAVYHAAGDVGGDLAGERDAGLEHDDARNPALVSDLVGDHLGVAAARSVDAFASSAAISVACALLALRSSGDVVVLGLLPLLVRSFGLVACATGVMVVRTEEAQSPDSAILRGHVSALLVLAAGLGGASHSLLGSSWWLFFSAGLLGPVSAALAAYAGKWRLARRRGAVKQALDTLRVGDGATVAAGLGAGLESALLPVLLLGGSGIAAWLIGERSGIPAGAELAVLSWLAALSALSPYAVAVATFSAIADSARGMASIGAGDPETQRRAARLDDTGFGVSVMAHSYGIVVSAASGLGIAIALSILLVRPPAAAALTMASPAVVWCGALGAALVLAYAGNAARAAVRAARDVSLEVERQLRGFPREQGLAVIPADYTPSYKSCEEITAKSALSGGLTHPASFLLVPLLLGIVLRLMYRPGSSWLLTDGLTSFVVVAAVTGLGAGLVVDGARAALGSARRATRPRGSSPGYAASVSGDVVADILGNVAGPAAHLMGKAGAALLLAVAPFLL